VWITTICTGSFEDLVVYRNALLSETGRLGWRGALSRMAARCGGPRSGSRSRAPPRPGTGRPAGMAGRSSRPPAGKPPPVAPAPPPGGPVRIRCRLTGPPPGHAVRTGLRQLGKDTRQVPGRLGQLAARLAELADHPGRVLPGPLGGQPGAVGSLAASLPAVNARAAAQATRHPRRTPGTPRWGIRRPAATSAWSYSRCPTRAHAMTARTAGPRRPTFARQPEPSLRRLGYTVAQVGDTARQGSYPFHPCFRKVVPSQRMTRLQRPAVAGLDLSRWPRRATG
jgi:hypothetical protein